MLRTPITIGLVGMFILLGVAILRPTLGTEVINSVLGTFQTSNSSEEPIPTAEIPSLADIEKGNFLSLFEDSSISAGEPLTAENIIAATNKERATAKLQPLKMNAKLNASAKIKVEDMIKQQYFEHVSPNGVGVADLGSSVGYVYVVMGENLALGNFDGTNELVTAWMNSPGHRANILNTKYKDIGVYAIRGTYQGRVVWFAVQHFGTQRTACPAIDQTLKAEIDSINKELQTREAQLVILRKEIEDPDHPEGEEYADMIARFNRKVETYNNLRDTSEVKISLYNQQVASFNKCLSLYQAK